MAEYEWTKPSKVPDLTDDEGDLNVGDKTASTSDIEQNDISNDYFLSSLSILADKEGEISKLFCSYTNESVEIGIYYMQFHKNGELQRVFVDDSIVTHLQKPAFAGTKLWVALVEKAWAKIHGNYAKIIEGKVHETLRDLTGAPTYEYSVE